MPPCSFVILAVDASQSFSIIADVTTLSEQ